MAKAKAKGKKQGGFDLQALSFGGVDQKELTQFTRQFATLINAGLTTVRSLDILQNTLNPGPLKKASISIKDQLEQGTPLSEAMAQHPKVFDKLYSNMIRAGEAGGILDVILNRLAEFREKAQKIAQDIKSAMMYPTAVVGISGTIVTAILVLVVPKFQKMFEDMDLALPAMTQSLIAIKTVIMEQWYLPAIVALLLFIGLKVASKFKKGRFAIDYTKMYIPIFGGIIRKGAVSRFCRTLGTLLDSGVPMIEGLVILREASGNEVLAAVIDEIIVSVKQGDPITRPLANSRMFDEMVVSMMEVGDEAGRMPEMMVKIADNYDGEVDALVAGMKSMIEPLLIVGLGMTVGYIVVALFLPLISMMDNM